MEELSTDHALGRAPWSERPRRHTPRSLAAAGSVALAAIVLASEACGAAPLSLPASDMPAVYKAAGLTERGGKILDACDTPIEPEVTVVDLNGDGQPEVFVQAYSACYGMAGGELSLLIKTKQGAWKNNFGFPAGQYKLLSAKSQGYPDIEIGGPGVCSPIWRWNGKEYALHKRCDP